MITVTVKDMAMGERRGRDVENFNSGKEVPLRGLNN